MDSEGNIYHLYNNSDADKVAEEMDLVLVPLEELSKVSNMDQRAKKEWYKGNKEAA